MIPKISFFVKGREPYPALQRLLLDNGILKNLAGLPDAVVSQREVAPGLYLYQLSAERMRALQFEQGIPFAGFQGEKAAAFEPKSVLVVSKDTREKKHLEAVAAVRRVLRQLGIRHRLVNIRGLRTMHLTHKDLVMPVGGDGTFLRAANWVRNGIPFLGVISNPQDRKNNQLGSWGHYMLVSPERLEEALNLVPQGEFEMVALTRLWTRLNQGISYQGLGVALNEVAVLEGEPEDTAHYKIRVGGMEEHMSDSGLLMATGAGSPANAWMFNAGGLTFSPTSHLVQFKAREPSDFLRNGEERALLHGFADQVEVFSSFRHRPRLVLDSFRPHPFPAGSSALVMAGDLPLSLLVFPSIRRSTMTPPEMPVAEIVVPKENLVFRPGQIKEIDALPICATVAPGEKRQILFLQCAEDLDQLRVARILKSGGVPLTEEDFSLKAAIKDPTLLYPTAQIGALPSVLRDIVHNLYTYGLRVTEYGGVVTEWDASVDKNVWGPSIDTIALILGLLKGKVFGPHIRSAAEVGTGAGMVAKAAVIYCPRLERLVITDVEKHALDCAERNLMPVLGGMKLQSIHVKGIRLIGRVDLLKVNPPYLPEKRVSGETDQYRGLGLIEEVLREGQEHLNPGGSVVINYSSCAGKEFDQWVRRYDWKVRPLYSLEVPLKINRVNEDREWLAFMLEHGGLAIRNDAQYGYRYWHTLNVVQLIAA